MLTRIEKYLLDIGAEDCSRVWEATVAHTHANPLLQESDARRLAKETIRKLLNLGLIDLYFDNLEDSTEHNRIARKLDAHEIDAVFEAEESWSPGRPIPDRGYAFVTTQAGEIAAYS